MATVLAGYLLEARDFSRVRLHVIGINRANVRRVYK